MKTNQVVPSHLMPPAMYRYSIPPGGYPLLISSTLVIDSDRQLQDYLLCEDCESDLT